MLKTKVLHFLGVFLFSGVIIGTPFTVHAIANSTHAQQNHEDNSEKNKNDDKKKNNDSKENKDKDSDKNIDQEKQHSDCDERNNRNLCITPTPSKRPIKIIRIIRKPIIKEPVFLPINNSSTSNTQTVVINQTSPEINITNNNNPEFSNSNTITINNNTKNN